MVCATGPKKADDLLQKLFVRSGAIIYVSPAKKFMHRLISLVKNRHLEF